MARAAASTLLILSLLVVPVAALGCKQAVTEPEQGIGPEKQTACLAQEQFCGSWNWISICGRIAPRCRTSDSEGRSQRLNLEKTGDYEMLVDDALWAAGRYSIVAGDSRFEIRYEAEFGPLYQRQWIELRGLDMLVLDDGCCDLYSHTFARIEEAE